MTQKLNHRKVPTFAPKIVLLNKKRKICSRIESVSWVKLLFDSKATKYYRPFGLHLYSDCFESTMVKITKLMNDKNSVGLPDQSCRVSMLNICANCFPSLRESTNNVKSLFHGRKKLKHCLIVLKALTFLFDSVQNLGSKTYKLSQQYTSLYNLFSPERLAVMCTNFSFKLISASLNYITCEEEPDFLNVVCWKYFRLVTICSLHYWRKVKFNHKVAALYKIETV